MTPPGPGAADLLVSGDDRPPRRCRPAHRAVAAAGALAVALGAGVLAGRGSDRDAPGALTAQDQAVVRLSLLAPGQDGGPRYGPRPAGVHLVIGNTGPAPVRVLWGTLAPGEWQVTVPADAELRSGRSMVLALTPPRACGTPEPRVLQVEALPLSGPPRTAALDLASAGLAYGGTFADALALAAADCDPTARPATETRTYPHRSEVVRPSR